MRKMKKMLSMVLALQLCLGTLLISSCATGGDLDSTQSQSSAGETTQREFVPIVEYKESGSGIWFDRYYFAANDAKRKDYGTYINENVSDGYIVQKAYLKFVMDTTQGDYTLDQTNTLVKIKSSVSKEKVEEYAAKGYKELSVQVLVQTSYVGSVKAYYPIFGVKDGVRQQINNKTHVFKLNEWAEIKYPLSWLIDDFQMIQDKYLFTFPSSLFGVEDIYTIYFGDIGLK